MSKPGLMGEAIQCPEGTHISADAPRAAQVPDSTGVGGDCFDKDDRNRQDGHKLQCPRQLEKPLVGISS